MAWVQISQTLPTHRKTLVMAETLNMLEVHVVGHLTVLWLWALDNAPNGVLPASLRVIARAAQWPGEPSQFVDALLACGFVDNFEGQLIIHDWEEYTGRLQDKRRADAERKRQERAVRGGRGQTFEAAGADVRDASAAAPPGASNGCPMDVPRMSARKEKSTVEKRRVPNGTVGEERERADARDGSGDDLNDSPAPTGQTAPPTASPSTASPPLSSANPIATAVATLWGVDTAQPSAYDARHYPRVVSFFEQANAPPEEIQQFFAQAFPNGSPPHLSQVAKEFPRWKTRQHELRNESKTAHGGYDEQFSSRGVSDSSAAKWERAGAELEELGRKFGG